MTADDLQYVDIPGKVTELVSGQLVVREPPGTLHGRVAAALCYYVSDHVRRHALGSVYADSGFRIETDPDTVRAPNVAFVTAARAVETAGYAPIVPDLVIEVVPRAILPGSCLPGPGCGLMPARASFGWWTRFATRRTSTGRMAASPSLHDRSSWTGRTFSRAFAANWRQCFPDGTVREFESRPIRLTFPWRATA